MKYSWNFKAFTISLCFALVAVLISELPQKIRSINDNINYHYTQTETFHEQNQEAEENDTEENYVDGVYCTKYGKCYHREYCRYLKSKIYVSVETAKSRGLRPCEVCMPPE